MVEELKNFIEQEKVFFGIKECLRKSGEIERALVSVDCRESIVKLLKINKVMIEKSEFSKEEIANKVGMKFKCEVFGLKK